MMLTTLSLTYGVQFALTLLPVSSSGPSPLALTSLHTSFHTSALKPLSDLFPTLIWFRTSPIKTSVMSGVHDTGVLRARFFSPVVTASTEALSSAASLVTVCKSSAAGGGSAGGGDDGGGSGGGGGNSPAAARGCGVDEETSGISRFSSGCGLPVVAFRFRVFLFGGIIAAQWTRRFGGVDKRC